MPKFAYVVNRPLTLSLCHRSVHSICASVCLCLRFGSVSKSHREDCEAKWRMPSSSSKVNQSANPPVETSRLNKVCKCVCLQVQWSWADPLPGLDCADGGLSWCQVWWDGPLQSDRGQRSAVWGKSSGAKAGHKIEREKCVCLVDGMNYVQPESVVWDIRGEVRASEPLNTSP